MNKTSFIQLFWSDDDDDNVMFKGTVQHFGKYAYTLSFRKLDWKIDTTTCF